MSGGWFVWRTMFTILSIAYLAMNVQRDHAGWAALWGVFLGLNIAMLIVGLATQDRDR